MICIYCNKEFLAGSSYSNHIRRCRLNPNRKYEVLTEEGRKRIRKGSAKANSRWARQEEREKHSKAMKIAVKNNPESYSSSNRGRTKQIEIDGIKFQGKWEVEFYNWARIAGLKPIRPKESFLYSWNGDRWYHPDFYLEAEDCYVEVKGYETDRDRAKWLCFPKKLVIIKAEQIHEIRKGTFTWAVNSKVE